MKKIFGAMLLSAVALTGCLKDNDDSSYREYQQVAPGANLFSCASVQNTIALQPADYAMRLAILLSEARKQGETDLKKVVDSNKESVLTNLFGTAVQIEGPTEENKLLEGQYRIIFLTSDAGSLRGALIVDTGGVLLEEATMQTKWTVELSDLKANVTLNGVLQVVKYTGGQTSLSSRGDGSYTVTVSGIRTHFDGVERYSDWGGSFIVRPDATSLAYSDCHGKDVVVSGGFGGATLFSFSTTGASTKMSFNLSEGKYILSGKAYTGTVTCRLIGTGDYDQGSYPSPEVQVIWTYDSSRGLLREIRYNGFTYSK